MTTLNFFIEYITHGHSQVCLDLYLPEDANNESTCIPMVTSDGRIWQCAVCLNSDDSACLHFRFHVEDNGQTIDSEARNALHRCKIMPQGSTALHCRWITAGSNSYLYSSAYKDCLFACEDNASIELADTDESLHKLYLIVPEFVPHQGQRLLLVGNSGLLGNWNPSNALPVKRTGHYSMQVAIDADKLVFPMEYKFVLQDEKTLETVWEAGDNRRILSCDGHDNLVIEQSPLRFEPCPGRTAGLVVPVFSLRSCKSCGVGDFGDLHKMIDIAAATGLHVVQILPVNDTSRSGTWADSYPYNGISVFALHPMYVCLRWLKPLKDKKLYSAFQKEFEELNRQPSVDYEKVNRAKNAYLQAYYLQEGLAVEASAEYADFVAARQEWLRPYCYFRFFQQLYGTSDFRHWPRFSRYNKAEIRQWLEQENRMDEVRYYAFLQFVLYEQLSEVHAYARRKKVVLKGDIPIGVSRDSATAWANPAIFNFDGQAGAPPDYFSADGQNWGFPTYNWQEILKDGGRWWQDRLRYMADFFDAYRIDHVLGFFRIWEIPFPYRSGMTGHFNPALPLSDEEIRAAGFKASLPVRQPGHAANADEEVLKEQLFFEDAHTAGKYHPNIGGKATSAYSKLTKSDKEAYNRIYDDFFFHRHDDFWARGAIDKLSLLTEATNMLPCAEDLGMIPACMRKVLDSLHILSLEVESMPKYSWKRFADVDSNPLLSVDTITTHDMPPLRLWWQRNAAAAQEYYTQVLRHTGKAPQEMPATLCAEILLRHLNSPSLLCVIALQDWLSMDERLRNNDLESEQINNPADPHHYWRYRMHLFLEDLEADASFTGAIKTLLARSGRA